MSLVTEIRARRVLPAIGVYIGACWVVIEILDRLVERYFLSPYITDMAFWGLYSLLPAVVLVAWTHGRPGRDKSTRLEKVGVPANLIATLGLLITVFGGKDIGATAEVVSFENELGQTEEHFVPRDSYRRRMAVFFWDNDSGDPALDWMQFGITELLTQDLQQNPFMLVVSPWQNLSFGFKNRVERAGFPQGTGLPLSLMREIAASANRSYFIEGGFDRTGGEWNLTARLWKTDTLEQLAEINERGREVMPVVDRISSAVREELEVPSGRIGLVEDLPLIETYGESERAFRAYIEGLNAKFFDNDWQASNGHYEAALAADPGFVLAWYMMGLNHWEQGDVPAAQAAFNEAQKLAFRLPERDQTRLKGLRYGISGEQEKLEKFRRLQVRISDDAEAHRELAHFLMLTGRLEEAKQYYGSVMERDVADFSTHLHLAVLERATGNLSAALDEVQSFLKHRPDDHSAILLKADLLLEAGEFEQAKAAFEHAQLLEEPPVLSTLRLALLHSRQGEWALVRAMIDDASKMSESAVHANWVLQAEMLLELRRGRIGRALALQEQREAIDREVMSPVEQVMAGSIPKIQLNLMIDRLDEAEQALESARARLQPPINQLLSFSEALIRVRQGDFDAATQALARGRETIELYKADYLAFQIPLVSAEMEKARGNYRQAAEHFRQLIAAARRSVVTADLRSHMVDFQIDCAEAYVKSGQHEKAQAMLDRALRQDSAHGKLWVVRALLQSETGSKRMALASLEYALAIWSDADPDYRGYREALDLRSQIAGELD